MDTTHRRRVAVEMRKAGEDRDRRVVLALASAALVGGLVMVGCQSSDGAMSADREVLTRAQIGDRAIEPAGDREPDAFVKTRNNPSGEPVVFVDRELGSTERIDAPRRMTSSQRSEAPQPASTTARSAAGSQTDSGSGGVSGGWSSSNDNQATTQTYQEPAYQEPVYQEQHSQDYAYRQGDDIEPTSGRQPEGVESTRSFPSNEEVVYRDGTMGQISPPYFDGREPGTITLYNSSRGGGHVVGVWTTGDPDTIVFQDHDDDVWEDNAGVSVGFNNIPAGTVVRLYDNPLGNRQFDWAEIQVKKDLLDHTVDHIERNYYDEFVTVVWFRRGGLANEVSRLEVDMFHERELPHRPISSNIYEAPETLDRQDH